jgi:hypothetical protein
MKREAIEDAVFGTLTWSEQDHWWSADMTLTSKHEVEVTIDWDEEEPLREVLARCRVAFLRLRSDEWDYRLATAANLVEVYNDAWRPRDAPKETRESFARKLELATVGLSSEGAAELWYHNEGDFFAGHAIVGHVDADGVFDAANLAG